MMTEIDEFTMSGKTLDLLKKELNAILTLPLDEEMTGQTHMELVNLCEALDAPDGFCVTYEFDYNS